MLDLSKYPKRTFTEEEAKQEVANVVAIWAIEGMKISEAKQQVMFDYLMGKLSDEDYDERYFAACEEDK